MSFFQLTSMWKFKKIFRDAGKWTIKCVHLKFGIEYCQTCLNNEFFQNAANKI